MNRDLVCAFDSSTPLASVAVFSIAKNELVANVERVMDRAHGEGLLPLVDEVLTSLGLGPRDVGRWAVGVGPGSFTGTRIGGATAKGIVLATGAELVGVSAFDALCLDVAPDAKRRERVVALLDAQKGELYVRVDGEAPFYQAAGLVAGTLGRRITLPETALLVGAASADVELAGARRLVDRPHDVPRASAIARLAARAPAARAETVEPDYVRPADVTR